MNKPVWIRLYWFREVVTRDEYLHQLADFIQTSGKRERVEVLPYHTLGTF